MADRQNEGLTIVSGLPRSGTSMMMRMIDAGGVPALIDNIREADEDNPRGYYEFEPVKKTKQDPSWLESAGGKVVKMVHLLLLDLPTDRDFRVVFMKRDLDEVVRSQDVMLDRSGKGGGGLSGDRIKQIFETQLGKVGAYLEQHGNFRVLYVNYNQAIADPSGTVRDVNEFLGGRLDTQAMRQVVEPALYRQREGSPNAD
ncbi:MAG: sulfotransferase domain-containing protein [Planctomycetes bacterium]|nr:sulfotransferase domain-containing protein [Planctomycetota bacterium]